LSGLTCFTRQPSTAEIVPTLAAASNAGDFYASRLRAILRPPVTGLYEFWIAGDDRAELWLSEDNHPGHTRRICLTDSWTAPEDWDQSPRQHSSPIHLLAGRNYYIEALHFDRAGGDCLAVAWRPPSAQRHLIPSRFLMPYPILQDTSPTSASRPEPNR
jgi:hypothetical protein